MQEAGLVRADSWEFPGNPNTRLLKTVSNAQEPHFLGATGQPAGQAPCPPAAAAGKPPLAPNQPAGTTLSSVSTLTAAGRPGGAGEPAAPVLVPMRQTSLDAITAADDLCGGAGSGARGGGAASGGDSAPDRSSIFNDVIEQLAAKEESLPMQTGLYTLPSIQFLESLLEDMDSKTGSSGQLPEPPLYLPLDAFDLPELDAKPLRPLGPSPFEAGGGQPAAQVFHISAAATMQQPVAQPAPHGFIPTSSSMPILPHGSGFQGGRAGSSQLPHCRSAGPSPAKPARRAASAYADYDYEEAELSLQMSKSGRVRKVASFAGAKRKMSGDVCGSRASLPDSLAAAHSGHHHHSYHHHHLSQHNTVSESDTGASVLDDESDEEVSKGSKPGRKQGGGGAKKGGKRTTCLNCGCHQTPQWRCGPLGPRTLCNACGVRYKKGLPLNCWPIREGMVLPPGAVLPPGVHIPGVILQPADDE